MPLDGAQWEDFRRAVDMVLVYGEVGDLIADIVGQGPMEPKGAAIRTGTVRGPRRSGVVPLHWRPANSP